MLSLNKPGGTASGSVFCTVFVVMILSSLSLAAEPIEEVVVTALKRSSTLQDTPIAISALTNEGLERVGADDFVDFVGSVPGLTLRDNGPGSTRPTIRGIASPGEPQVGVYFDEALVVGAPGTTNDAGLRSPELKPFDLERVEVLKGPQGTLYGGGSMGGTLRFITKKPNAEKFEGKISLEGSTVKHGDAGYQVNGMINIPIIKEQLALRVVAFKRDDPGFVDNIAYGKDDINDVDTEGGRVSIRWTPTDRFMATGTVYYQEQNVGGGFHYNPSIDDGNPKTDALSREPYNDEQVLYNLTLEYGFDWADALYSYSWFDRDAVFRFHNGFTGFPFPPVLSTQPEPLQAFSHELRLSSSGQNVIDWTVGAFYSDRNAFVDSRVQYPGADGRVVDDRLFLFRRTVNSDLIQRAIYGEATWHVNDRLALTAGIRYFDVDSGSDVINRVNVPGLGLPSGTPGRSLPYRVNVTRGSENGTIFKVHGAYHFTDDLLAYASFSQGFRPGGANQNTSSIALTDPGNVGVPEEFKSDTLDSYEIGVHSQWFDNRLTLNAAVYYIDWSDIVLGGRSATGLFGFLNNADSASATGFELESAFDLGEDFRLTAALSYVDAELDADAPVNRAGANHSRSGLKGDPIPNVPEWTVNASMEYGHPLPWMDLRGYVYLDVNYVGENFADFNEFLLDINTLVPTTRPNVQFNKQGDYAIVDLRVGVEGDDWAATLFLENVFDERAITHIFEDGTFRLDPGQNFLEKPRTFGVTLSRDF